jgi:hypothetical protein
VKLICAWCLKDLGDIAPEQPGVTHGVCEECKRKIMAELHSQRPTSSLDGGGVFAPPFTASRPFSQSHNSIGEMHKEDT